MLMAAGLGTRLRPFTEHLPKALIPVMGVPISQFAIDGLVRAGVKKIVANIHHLPEISTKGLFGLDRGQANLVLSDESSLLLGSAGGLKKALPHFDREPFFLINADVLYDIDLDRLARHHSLLRSQWGVNLTLAVLPAGPPEGSGEEVYREIHVDPSTGLIRGLGEPEKHRPFFAGAAVIEPEVIAGLTPDTPLEFVPSILLPAIAQGRAGALLSQGCWQDIGSPRTWLQTHLALIEGLKKGTLPQHWQKRIEAINRQIAPGIWIEKKHPLENHTPSWVSPCYWSSHGEAAAVPPQQLGPHAVLYGSTLQGSLAHGIGLACVRRIFWQG